MAEPPSAPAVNATERLPLPGVMEEMVGSRGAVAEAEVVALAVELKLVSVFAPLRALTSNEKDVFDANPVTVTVPHVALVCQTAVAPSEPLAWT